MVMVTMTMMITTIPVMMITDDEDVHVGSGSLPQGSDISASQGAEEALAARSPNPAAKGF